MQTDPAAAAEAQKIAEELSDLASRANVPLEILPVVKVKSAAEAAEVHEKEYDVVVVYAASGSGDLLKACFAPKKDRDTILFVRHRSGTTYYWYEALSTRYLQTGRPEPGRNSYLDHGPVHVDDVVVDDYDELLWRLRALYGLKNFLGTRIVALGGPWGKYSPEAPQVAREKYRFNIIDIPYDQIAPRIKAARENRDTVAAAQRWAEAYLALPHTTLATTKEFVTNAFVLYGLFKDLLREHEASAFTIRNCMSTIMPMAETTPCLTLGLLNDEGLMAFCESDFVIIPAGILLHHIAGTPVFLHNSTFPHDGIVTCAHCSSPRRLDGRPLRAGDDRDAFRVRVRGRPEGGDAGRPAGDVPRPRIQHRPLARLHGPRQEQPLLRNLPLPAGGRNPGRLEEAGQRGPRLALDDGLRRPPERTRLRHPQTRHPVGRSVIKMVRGTHRSIYVDSADAEGHEVLAVGLAEQLDGPGAGAMRGADFLHSQVPELLNDVLDLRIRHGPAGGIHP